MPHGKLRVAVCQFESHPALTIADLNYLREPCPPQDKQMSLGGLARHNLDCGEIQQRCDEEYSAWHAERLKTALAFLADPGLAPNLIVFPEAAIPVRLLPLVKEFAIEHNVTIFAGTHSYLHTRESTALYKELGVSATTLHEWRQLPWACTAVLPVFSGRKAYFHRKRVPSVFEITDVTPREQAAYSLQPLNIQIAGQKCRIVPLVCAEALQQYKATGPYDLAVICAYNAGTEPYDPFINHHVFNRIPVVLCNDGHYGGSGIHVPTDRRMNLWWWGEPFLGRLPRGDGILVAELDWDHLATQVGVANPKPAVRLECVAAVTYEEGSGRAYALSKEFTEIAEASDNTVQHERLTHILTGDMTQIQRLKGVMLHRLTREGTADATWWNTLGRDCQVAAQPDLAGTQARLARECADALLAVIQSGRIQDATVLGNAAKLMNACRKLAAPTAPHKMAAREGSDDAMIDREKETDELLAFLERGRQVACLVFGLDAVGKSTVIGNAIAKAGHRRVARLTLPPDITAKFLAVNILTLLEYPRAAKVADPLVILESILPARLKAIRVLIIEDAENLLDHLAWRDEDLKKVLRIIFAHARASDCRVIVESSTHLDLPIEDPNLLKRLPIRGLNPDDGLVLLNQQLRRAGLEPGDYSETDRKRIIEALAGHPGAIILAADYVESSGINEVVKDVVGKKGVYTRIVERVLRKLHLSDQESQVLSLLAEARAPLPARVLTGVTPFDPMPAIQDLRKLALIDRFSNDFVAITGLLRGFADFSPPKPQDLEAFHIAAATAFGELASRAEATDQLRWTVEARYHAISAGREDLAPEVDNVADGALGALSTMVKRNHYEAAFPLVQQLLAAHRSAEVLELGAMVYARLGKCDEALVLAKEAVSLQPQRVWVLTEVGRVSLYVHRVEVAEDALRIARATGTDSTFIATLEGQVFERKKQPEKAIEAYERGVKQSEFDGWPHFYLGRILIEQGRPEQAIKILEDGETIEGGRYRPRRKVLTAIRTQLALAYLHTDEIRSAERWLALVVEEDATNPEVARAFSYLRVKKGETDVASRALADLDPDRAKNRHERAQIHLFRGLCLIGIGAAARASEEFNQANLADPQNVFVLLKWAGTLRDMARDAKGKGDFEAAQVCATRVKDVAEKILQFDSDNPQALEILEALFDEFHVQ